MRIPRGLALLALGAALTALPCVACPPGPGPVPMPPDAQDGAPLAPPVTVPDGGTPCSVACAVLQALGCPTEPDCVTVYAHVESAKAKRTPAGALLTCAMVTSAQTRADIRALGIGCP